jgi:hypothetical protein
MDKLSWTHFVSERSKIPHCQSGVNVEVQHYIRSLNTIIKDRNVDHLLYLDWTEQIQA